VRRCIERKFKKREKKKKEGLSHSVFHCNYINKDTEDNKSVAVV
jgi:hypothetical protein